MNVRSKSKSQCNHICSINNKPLQIKSELKDLGVLTDNLKFSHHISVKVHKANQIMGLICRSSTIYVNTISFCYSRVWSDHI